MNCQEVQLQLSGYLEKSLDAVRMKGIETHLASCPFCRIEARGLSDCIALVSALPVLEPPAGFAQRVMAHARDYQLDVPLWQRLVAVLRTTAPIQATAVVLVGVLGILLYQRESRLQDSGFDELSPPAAVLKNEPEINPVAPPAQSARDSSVDRRADRAAPARAKAEPPSSSVAVAKPATESRPTPQAPAATSPDSPPQKAFEFPFPVRRAPFQAQEISTGRESFRQGPDAFGFGASLGVPNRQLYGMAPSSGRALSPLSEPTPDFEFIVRRRGLERREAADVQAGESSGRRSETDAAIASAAAQRAVPSPGATSSSIVEIRWFTVAPHHLDEFRKDLAAEANIDSEKKPVHAHKDSSSSDTADPLLIKVVILPSDH